MRFIIFLWKEPYGNDRPFQCASGNLNMLCDFLLLVYDLGQQSVCGAEILLTNGKAGGRGTLSVFIGSA